MAFLSVIFAIGVYGNINVLIVYWKNYQKSNVKIFILALAISDLGMCLLSVPVFIFDSRRPLTYIGDGICQLSRLNTVALSLSGLLLQTLIAVERYKKVCRPLTRQWKTHGVTIATISIFILSVVASIPTLVTIGKIKTNYTQFPDTQGFTCGAKLRFVNFIHATSILPIMTISLILVIIMYSLVLRTIVKRKAISRVFVIKRYNRSASVTSAMINEDLASNEYSAEVLSESNTPPDNGNFGSVKRKVRDRKMDKASRISVMFMFVFIFSYIGLLPIIALNIVRATDKERFQEMREDLGQFMDILLFGGLLNSIANPLVYILIDEKFRYYCKRLYCGYCTKP